PDWDLTEIFVSLLTGSCLAAFLYTRGIALHHAPKTEPVTKNSRGIPALTVKHYQLTLDNQGYPVTVGRCATADAEKLCRDWYR
ncbi:MAG: hypothetical protein IKK96_04690, partial [Lachnospiraceae bacterium]|nr:hypothetical protein [Lachnospiraceae bacterium]